MATCYDVFDIAIALMDEVNESTGSTRTTDTKEYELRTTGILTALGGELYPYSDTYKVTEAGKRPVFRALDDMESELDLDEYLAKTVLPYGLAAQLLLDENPASASFLQQRYEEMKRTAGSMPGQFDSIVDVYGMSNEYGEFSRWG